MERFFPAVKIVIYRNNPYPQKRENLFHIIADFDIIPPDSRKIFHYNALNLPGFYICHKPLPTVPVETGSRRAVVRIDTEKL